MKTLFLMLIPFVCLSIPCFADRIFNIDMTKVTRIIFVTADGGHYTAIVNKATSPLTNVFLKPYNWEKYDDRYFDFDIDNGDLIAFLTLRGKSRVEFADNMLIEENKNLKKENKLLKERIDAFMAIGGKNK